MGDPYFASQKTEDFLPLLFERIDRYYRSVEARGLLNLWRASHSATYAGFFTGGKLQPAGENGKFTAAEANEYRNLQTHVLNLVTAQKSQPEAMAKNMDYESQQQTVIANGLAETLADDHELETKVRQVVAEKGLQYGEGWVVPCWDESLGEVFTVTPASVDPETGAETAEKALHAGDLRFDVFHPLDLVRDVTRPSLESPRWYCGRRRANRYDLMALHPEMAEEIDKVPSALEQAQSEKRPSMYTRDAGIESADDSDDVLIWEFMHEKTPAVESGRIVQALSESCWLVDDALPYRELPHIRWAAGDIEGLPFGYSMFFDCLAPQQAVNAALSAIATRVSTFGVPNLWASAGANLQMTQLGKGLNIFEGGDKKPELLDFASIPPELVKFIEMFRGFMATYSGINNTARGQPEGGITAASALALLEARAVQFVALSQKADIELMKRLYTKSLHHLQDHAKAEILVRMAGESNRSRVMNLKPGGVSQVSGYSVRIGNPLQSTVAGRMQVVEGAKAVGIQMTAEQYWQVMTTGKLEPVTEAPQREAERIRAENEMLTRGEDPTALLTDDHPRHIREHCMPLSDPESQKDPGLVARALAHLQDHQEQWIVCTVRFPTWLAAKGIPPAPMPQDMTQQPQPGETTETPAPQPGESNATGPLAEQQPGPGQVPVRQARPAKSPLTGVENPHPQVSA